jgi:hypothetical protein
MEAAAREGQIAPEKDEWFHYTRLPDGSDYLRWSSLFEFLISPDGRRIAGRALTELPSEAFQTYLLGQVLSFALLKMGLEPLHATVAVVEGWAVDLLGNSGYGKSSLGAAFLHAGHRLLTDDLLLVKQGPYGFYAQPGHGRIKVFPEVAKAFLEELAGTKMNPLTPKLVIPLGRDRAEQSVKPLKVLYVLRPPTVQARSKRIRIRPFHPREGVLKVIGSTFNTVIRAPDRLARQFRLATQLAACVPIKSPALPSGTFPASARSGSRSVRCGTASSVPSGR